MFREKKNVETVILAVVLVVLGVFLKDYIKVITVMYPLLLVISLFYFFKKNNISLISLVFSISLIYTIFIYAMYPKIYYDDTGFIIRYFHNFWEGYWFKFNIKDAPIFGVSGFLYGLIGGVLCYFKLVKPEDAIDLLTVVGVFFTSFFVFKIQSKIFKRVDLSLIFWLLCMFGNTYFLNSANKGLETPFHIAIVLAAFYFFIIGNGRLMWLFMGLSVASKLDAVPSMLVLGIVYLIGIGFSNKPLNSFLSFLQSEFLFAVSIIAVYLILTFVFFGSPLPHSGATKLIFHQSNVQHWFPFLEPLTNQGSYLFILYLFVILFITTFFVIHKLSLQNRLIALVFGFSFLGTMVLYYVYNPFERMMWYYPLPLFFMFIQIGVSTYFISNTLFQNRKLICQFLIFIIAASAMLDFVIQDHKYAIKALSTTEVQRMQIGYDLAARTQPQDTVASHHGLTTCRTNAYVLDMTGLNSSTTTDEKLDLGVIIHKFTPQWYETHINDWCLSILNDDGHYHIDRQYYSFVKYGYQPITLFKRDELSKHVFEKVNPENIVSFDVVESCGDFNTYISNRLEIKGLNFDKNSLLHFGNERFGLDYFLIIEEHSEEGLVYSSKIFVPSANEETPSEKITSIIHQIHSENIRKVVVKSEVDWINIHISAPVLERIFY